ncbi:fasciclin domain-containing protein [Demetria terragena]|uniref:fasciclin domain-containing protein n=1 Tax=Demetria terragena TaxID=63959 RepID=UPI0003636D2D|nr:fasciclin domain-containing protein [Demetria terragena]
MKRTTTALAFSAILALSLSACGGDESSESTGAGDTAAASSPAAAEKSSEAPAESSKAASADNAEFGPGCKAVPADGAGSFAGMAKDPVATAASNNKDLSTLVTAVKKAGLVDTLNTSKDITVFAPANSAFAKIPEADLNKVLGDKKALTGLLTHHVVKGKLAPADLAGEHKTLAGDTVTVSGSKPDFDVAGAKVACGNVQTANATVYIIDSVLMPAK